MGSHFGHSASVSHCIYDNHRKWTDYNNNSDSLIAQAVTDSNKSRWVTPADYNIDGPSCVSMSAKELSFTPIPVSQLNQCHRPKRHAPKSPAAKSSNAVLVTEVHRRFIFGALLLGLIQLLVRRLVESGQAVARIVSLPQSN